MRLNNWENPHHSLACFGGCLALILFLSTLLFSIDMFEKDITLLRICFSTFFFYLSYIYIRVSLNMLTRYASHRHFWFISVPYSAVLLVPLLPRMNDGTFGVHIMIFLFNAIWFYFLYCCYQSISDIKQKYQSAE